MKDITFKEIKDASPWAAYCPLAVMALLTSVSGVIARLSIIQIVLYICVQILVVFLCGDTLITFSKLEFKDSIAKIFASYAVGYAVFVLVYIFSLWIGIPKLSVSISVAIAAVNLIFRIVKRSTLCRCSFQEPVKKSRLVVACFFIVLSWCVMFLCFQAEMLSADITGFTNMHPDNQFWFREAVEGTRGLPMADFSAVGVLRKYYYFSGTWCSYLHFFTGIELFDICFSLSWIGDLFLMVGGVYILFSEVTNIGTFGLVAAYGALMFTTTTQKTTSVYYVNHLYVAHFGWLPGAAMGMAAFALFVKVHRERIYNALQIILCLATFLVAFGLKGPNACIVIVGIGFICILDVLFGNDASQRIKGLICGICFLALFLIAFRLLLRGYPVAPGVYKVANTQDRLSLSGTVFKNAPFRQLNEALSLIFENQGLSVTVTYMLFWFMCNFVVSIFLIVALVEAIRKKVKLDIVNIACIVLIVSSYGLFTIYKAGGFSQVYFLMAAFPYGMYLALDVLGKAWKEEKRRIRFLPVMLAVILGVGVYKTWEYYYPLYAEAGYHNLSTRYVENNPYPGSNGLTVNKRELEALRWLRDNSAEDAITITNLALITDRGFVTCCYAERQAYLEGEGYGAASDELKNYRTELIRKYFEGDLQSAATLRKEGVDYAVIFASVPEYQGYDGEVVFENEYVRIVDLN